jgi:hypothetical protein
MPRTGLQRHASPPGLGSRRLIEGNSFINSTRTYEAETKSIPVILCRRAGAYIVGMQVVGGRQAGGGKGKDGGSGRRERCEVDETHGAACIWSDRVAFPRLFRLLVPFAI